MPKTATAAPAAKKQTAPAPERPHKDLSPVQEEVADLASRILLNGGEREEVETFLRALALYQWKQKSFMKSPRINQSEDAALTSTRVTRTVDHWYLELAKHWPAKPSVTPARHYSEQPERPVTEMVRANIRESFKEEIDHFLTDREGIEPVWLLREVIEEVNAGQELATAIWFAFDRADMYVRVPHRHKERIQEFAKFLEGEATK